MTWCTRCKKPLTDPKSVARGMGPVCHHKTETANNLAKRLRVSKAERRYPEAELDILSFLSKHNIPMVSEEPSEHGSLAPIQRADYNDGFKWSGGYSTHSFDRIRRRILSGKTSRYTNYEYVASTHDTVWAEKDLDGNHKDYAHMVISLYVKRTQKPTRNWDSLEDHLEVS